MKRITTFLLTFIIIFSLCACNKTPDSSNSSLLNTIISTESTVSDVPSGSSPSNTSTEPTAPDTSTTPSSSSNSGSSASSVITPPPSSTPSSNPENNTNITKIPEKLYILGDSYSAFEGCIPEGYETWYVNGGTVNTDITDKCQTWWHQLITNNNMTLIKNNSYSGTTICNTGYDGRDCSDTSFIGRFDLDVKSGFFENKDRIPDKIIVFGGINDSWANSPVGSIKWSEFSEDDLKCALPAFCYLILRIKECLPNTEIITVIDSEIKPELTNGYRSVCAQQNVKCVVLPEIFKKSGHPTAFGMRMIREEIINVINKK